MKTILAFIYYLKNADIMTYYNFGAGTYTSRRSILIGGDIIVHRTNSMFRSIAIIKGSGFVFKVLNRIKRYI